jgi:hypothetical protein
LWIVVTRFRLVRRQLAAVMAVRPHTEQDRNARGLFPAVEGKLVIPDNVFINKE